MAFGNIKTDKMDIKELNISIAFLLQEISFISIMTIYAQHKNTDCIIIYVIDNTVMRCYAS